MMFLRQEDFATVVRSTPLVSLDFIVENSRGEFLLGKRTNRPAQGYWFVPGGRVQKDETLEAALAADDGGTGAASADNSRPVLRCLAALL